MIQFKNTTATAPKQNNVIPVNFGRISREDEILQTQQTIDNAVFEMLQTVAQVNDWDMELIGDTREAIAEVLEHHRIIESAQFYPTIAPEERELDTLSGFLNLAKREVERNPLGFISVCLFAILGAFFLALIS